jgi:hypothetical protein
MEDYKQWIVDFVNDKGRDEREKLVFILHWLERKGLMKEFGYLIGESYGFRVSNITGEK